MNQESENKLTELDDLYKNTVSNLSETDRLSYCRERLDRVQHILEKNRGLIAMEQKLYLAKIIQAIQSEIRIIEAKN